MEVCMNQRSCLRRPLAIQWLRNLVGLLTLLAVVVRADDAHAYVNPGLAASLIQLVLTGVFGALAAVTLKPWRWKREQRLEKDQEIECGDDASRSEEQ
jgi:hypothetical protein